MSRQIFRKVALDRLASPEQLDQLVRVTTPLGWAALLALTLILSSVVVWSIYGNIPTVATGGGIIIKSGGVVSVVAPVSGQIAEVFVEEGDLVEKGQIVGRMAQPKLMDEIRSKKASIRELEIRERQISNFGEENLSLTTAAMQKEKESLVVQMNVDREQLKWLEEKAQIHKDLLDKGLIIKETYIDTQTKLNEVVAKVESTQGQIKSLEARLKEAANLNQQQLLMSQESVSEAKRALDLLEKELEFSSRIVSEFTGYVVEVRAFQGQAFGIGETVLSLELANEDLQELQALVYMPPDQGKKIRPGMTARITPQTVKREEFGYMLGEVTKVSEFPSSKQGMSRMLKNEALVGLFSQGGAPIAVFVSFTLSDTTPSGYKWSSSKGPDFKINSGTLCQGSVEVRSQAPISLAIPYLKKKLGLD